nr:MAG: hypothetical protein H4Bulk461084_000001 [Mitovirus sp.]
MQSGVTVRSQVPGSNSVVLISQVKPDWFYSPKPSNASLSAMLKVKLGRPAVVHVLGCVSLLGRRVNLSVVKVVITTLATYHRLYKHGGLKYLVIYLKACSSMLQQVVGGQRLHDLTPFGARVGRTHGGIPSLIPLYIELVFDLVVYGLSDSGQLYLGYTE